MISTTVVVGEVVLSALPARHWTDDTQVYLRMDCKGVTGKQIVAHTLKWPSGRVCLATCIKKKLKKKKKKLWIVAFQGEIIWLIVQRSNSRPF